jgi:hypothetical protein
MHLTPYLQCCESLSTITITGYTLRRDIGRQLELAVINKIKYMHKTADNTFL